MYTTARFLDSYRKASEDRAEIVPLSGDSLLFLVADGVGGRENGGKAATRAVEVTREMALAADERRLADPSFWEQMFRVVDNALSDDPTCGETTLVALYLGPKRIAGASVGDSEAWWIDGSENIRVITTGQRKPYLGHGMAHPVSFALETPPTGVLLVATDGLFKYTDPQQIVRTVGQSQTDLEAVAPALCDLVRSSSRTLYDDFAVLLGSPLHR